MYKERREQTGMKGTQKESHKRKERANEIFTSKTFGHIINGKRKQGTNYKNILLTTHMKSENVMKNKKCKSFLKKKY